MQRFVPMLVALGPAVLGAQQAAGAELWRLAGVTVSVPAALARDGAAAFWNPAQEADGARTLARSEEHTSELQSRLHLVCRLLLEKKKKNIQTPREAKRQTTAADTLSG